MTVPLLPSEELSNDVVDLLIESGLIRSESRKNLAKKISSGQMTGNDWEIEVEQSSKGESNK
ncbi:hypothetical protein RvVAR0630_11530 [Agrobacterium vitis]|uniref:hypothetical protein n=1 Tax=Agrobacterium vitis TaxID=373 RepID=UPI0015D82BAF|nr:hypothetical protein [Agrobacterium vitis]BCH58529.1 hypothetical protein RvVAR0630_11530 [Agrobacterium vitis]